MKSTLVALVFIFTSFSLSARELLQSERLVITNLEKTYEVMDYFSQQVETHRLSFRQRLDFEVSKRACVPVVVLLDGIAASETLADQTTNLMALMHACMAGVIQVSDLYRLQR